MMKKWKIEDKKLLKNLKIFDLFQYKLISPYSQDVKKSFDFYVFESVDWINVLPITKSGKVLFVQQYRPGTDSITLELPGGMADKNEDPIDSAKRELFEETGFSKGTWSQLGVVNPNPAILTNKCYTFLALNVEEVSIPQNAGSEFTEVKLINLEDLDKMVIEGKITHSLVINAIYWYNIYKDR
jgi:ADP-ribose pyrophosphatase